MRNKLDYYEEGEYEITWYSRSISKGSIGNEPRAKIELLKKFQNIKLLIRHMQSAKQMKKKHTITLQICRMKWGDKKKKTNYLDVNVRIECFI